MKKRPERIKVNLFYWLAEKFRKLATTEDEIERNDLTNEIIEALVKEAKKGGLINININGLPTTGKSITAIAIAYALIRQIFGREMTVKDIDRDQQEYIKTVMNPDIEKTVRVIDEWNELETAGENSSVIDKQMNTLSDVQAQRFIHKIACSPKDVTDKNSWLFLEVFGTDKQKMINSVKVYYRMFIGGYEHRQLIGVAHISVEKILKMEWYQEYRRRKFLKMEIMNKEGIFQPRKLDTAEATLKVVKKLMEATGTTGIMTPEVIRGFVKVEMTKRKMPLSIIGEELATRDVRGIVDPYKQYIKMTERMGQLKKKYERGAIDPETYKTQTESMGKEAKMIIEVVDYQIKELERYAEIKKKYDKILE